MLLYAVAVGAGGEDPTAELSLTTENTAGVRTAVLPSFAEIVTAGAKVDLGDVDARASCTPSRRSGWSARCRWRGGSG
ncbi:hypothetical protein [Pseudonocardia sp. ICBG162]|uniref:hypothetical protein n=1 Tax=Pseudonocardia sp. ICBG162 TaxID=2846761 RepID=UPI001CF7085E|nr:hypothetical protein [Pseudonocardia sp. ICBG162]